MTDEEFKQFSSGGKWIEESEDNSTFYDFENNKVITDYYYEHYKLDDDLDDEDSSYDFDTIHRNLQSSFLESDSKHPLVQGLISNPFKPIKPLELDWR